MTNPIPSILLIDDNENLAVGLRDALAPLLQDVPVDIRVWVPTESEPEIAFGEKVDDGTVLVITDYDLTTSVKGLFGLSIVGWCQSRSIPVGDFSRGNLTALPKEPNLFELRVPTDNQEGAAFIASTFRGFQEIRAAVEATGLSADRRNLAGVLADLLKRPHLESQFALYMNRLGAANSALLQKLRDFAGPEVPDDAAKVRLLTYVLGHVLLNAIIKYPGPVLSDKALCAYLATVPSEITALEPIFATARYAGPFSASGPAFWRENVDAILDDLGEGHDADAFESFGDYNRHVVQVALSRELAKHDCDRCGGVKGGFWCPFTLRPVCERADCSVPSSSWIPQGAQLARVERGFYDEWAPLLGL